MTDTADNSGGAYPDFLIVGAMKSGTTSLYTELRRHPEVFMPDREIGFFDIDDLRQHPDFFKMHRSHWHYHPYTAKKEELHGWYRSLFEGAEGGQVVGERSTTYLASEVAAGRIRETIPEARLIFMLRDPVPRAYSNYWHLLRSGEATGSFEQTLRYRHSTLFDRGLYRRRIDDYVSLFPRDQLLFIAFEEYIRDPEAILREVCEFIGVDPGRRPEKEESSHENRGRYPWSLSFQCALNQIVFHGLLEGHRYLESHLPELGYESLNYGSLRRWYHSSVVFGFKALSRVNCSRRKRPRMRPATRELLKYLYEDRNQGLSDLIDKDLSRWWNITDV